MSATVADSLHVPAVSVVLYVHDGEAYLGELLDSVFAQTFGDFELCVVDDGSTDATPAILAAVTDPRVRVSTTPGNGREGLHLTFNQGMAMARAGLIAVANADDVWRPTKLERQVAEFAADPTLDVCFHDASFIDARGLVTYGGFRRMHSLNVIDGMRGRMFLAGDMVPNPTVMFRRDIVRVIGVQETGWMHDYQFWMKAALAGCTFRSLPERLVKYRVHEASHSTSSVRRARIQAEGLAMVAWMLDRYGIADLYPELAGDDDEVSLAYCHLDLAKLLRTSRQEARADVELATARRLAPTHVGAGTTDVQWFGAQPPVAARLRMDVPQVPRVRLPAARAVVALPVDVDPDSVDDALRELLTGEPAEREPAVVLTDDTDTTMLAYERYQALVESLGVDREPQIDLLQVRPGELASVIEGNLLDDGELLRVEGGPATAACLAAVHRPVPALR